ncbi:GntR family transcriptional regulator [Polycladidibacter hongkongensis]|uniref:GntR family transcriptional regulator n=1 Tax=Polycladidibacter hongkongensis TaxID=1647556 RepID=UPI00082B02C7|nr:GntR family transcriptional regulator [Pseudovibrio hongkongensis]
MAKEQSTVDEQDANEKSTRTMLREDAYSAFIDCMWQRTFRPGHLISQREICSATGFAITAVREALKRLESERVVTLIPQKGVVLREIGVDEIKDIYQARRLIELPAIRCYVANATSEELQGFRDKTEKVLASSPQSREARIQLAVDRRKLDNQLHRTFIAALENELLTELFHKLETRLLLVQLQLPALYSDHGNAFEEHMEILTAIAAGNPEKAAKALDDHLQTAESRAISAAEF